MSLNPIPTALVESLRSIGYTLDTALADIIDNCITAEAKNISVRFLWNKGKPWVAICDDGQGMSQQELVEAMKFGAINPNKTRDSEDLGRFGLGMKTASISQCRKLTVAARTGNKTSACEWDLSATPPSGISDCRILEDKALSTDVILSSLALQHLSGDKTGAIVLWRQLDPSLGDPKDISGEERFSAQLAAARKHLELVFHRFLSPALGQRKVAIDFNDTPLEAFDPFGTSVPARQELPAEKIVIHGQVVSIQPYVLPHHAKAASVSEYQRHAGEEGYLHNQGFYIYRNRRLIIKATWFRLIPKNELNKLIRVRVDIPNSLDDLWRIDVKKSQANPPETVRKELKRIITKISGAGRIVFTNRSTRLQNRTLTPVWERKVVDGVVHYGVNEEYPIVKALLKELPRDQVDRLRASFFLLNSTFPYDMYYADAADDKTKFPTSGPSEDVVLKVGSQLVLALRSCGIKETELRKNLENSEFFTCSPELIEKILTSKGEHDG